MNIIINQDSPLLKGIAAKLIKLEHTIQIPTN